MTMLELSNKVLQFVGGTSEVVYRPLPADDPCSVSPRSSRRRRARPTTGLDDSLAPAIEYFRTAKTLA